MLPSTTAPAALLTCVVAAHLLLLSPTTTHALTAGERDANSSPRLILGADPGEQFGTALAMPGDITGDGVPDLLVGAPGAREGSGRVYLFSGADILANSALHASDAWATYDGLAGTAFGAQLAILGDVDGDGWTDWALGAPSFPGGDAPPGRIWIMPGAATVSDAPLGPLASVQLAAIDGPNNAARFGQGITGVGDIDGDGRADIAVLSRDAAAGEGTGQLRLVLGRAAANWPASTDFAVHAAGGYTLSGLGDPGLGFALDGLVAGAGDLNGDGLGDLWVGQPGHTGAATRSGMLLLLPGRDDGEVSAAADAALTTFTPDPMLFGSVDLVDAHFGRPLSLQSSDDGTVLWVGADGPDRGTALGLRIGAEPWVTEAGAVGAIAAPPAVLGGLAVQRGDLLGDGRPALVVGVPRDEEGAGTAGAGRVAVLDDDATMREVTGAYAAFLGTDGQRVGRAVEVVNLDQDSYDDAFVGAPGAYGAGAVLVLLGADLSDGDGFAPSDGDCDDALDTVHPAAREISACADGLDNDCNGLVDGADEPCTLEESGIVVGCSAGGGAKASWAFLLLLPMLRRRRSWAASMVIAAGVLVGCPSATAPVAPPAIAVVSPVDGDAFTAMSVLAVEVSVEGARLAAELAGVEPTDDAGGPPPVLWSLYVDDFFRGTSGGPLLVAENIGPGTHNIVAELVDTLGAPFDPPITAEVSVRLIAGEPTVVLTEPTEGEVLSPTGFTVLYDVAGLLLNSASIGQPNQLGVGHALVTLDGSLVATDADGQAFVANPGTGEHELVVKLVNNDGSDLDPAVSDGVSITVAEPEVTIVGPTGTVVGGDVDIVYEVANFTLDPVNVNGTPQEGTGHAHVYLDGLYQGLDASGSLTVPGVDGCNHVARIELALAGHAELGIFDEATFSVAPCVAFEGLSNGGTVNSLGGSLTLAYTTVGHDVSVNDGRYITKYVDGAYVAPGITPGTALFTGVSPGEHTFEIRLAEGGAQLGQDGELDPRASARITLIVSGSL